MEDAWDVVVVGSGAAGMSAALTAAKPGLSMVVIEKAAHFGGSTARSGGGVWIPNNEVLRRDGVRDTPEAARAYLHSIVGDAVPAERIDTYLDRGPEAIAFVLANSPLRMQWVPDYSDYYPRGARRPGRRALDRAGAVRPGAARLRTCRPRTRLRQGTAQRIGDAGGLPLGDADDAPPARGAARAAHRDAVACRDGHAQGARGAWPGAGRGNATPA